MELILASSSPRRRELLTNAGFRFQVRPSKIEEGHRRGEAAEAYVCRVAREKALAVALCSPESTLILAADTVVEAQGEILGKPAGSEDASRMLRLLSDSTHRVVTGVCLVRAPDKIVSLKHATTLVTFRSLDDEEIQFYVSTGEPLDKAGAYAIQGLASRFVARIEGCYFNVVGLPVPLVYEMLKPFLKQ